MKKVAEAVQEMLARPWPRTAADVDGFVHWHHLEGIDREGDGVAALSNWGEAAGGLAFHEGEFTGVHLFLWHALDPIGLIDRFRELSQAFTTLCGDPEDEWGDTGAPAAAWRTPTHVIDLYAHTGAAPCVQLAVEDAYLADAAEAAARARQAEETHPLAALGAPVDSASFEAAQHQTDELTTRTERVEPTGSRTERTHDREQRDDREDRDD